jgi:hypothetical protein
MFALAALVLADSLIGWYGYLIKKRIYEFQA